MVALALAGEKLQHLIVRCTSPIIYDARLLIVDGDYVMAANVTILTKQDSSQLPWW